VKSSLVAEELTDQQQQDYLDNHGLNCPWCGSDDLEGAHFDLEGQEARAEAGCNSCGKRWVDVYSLIGIEKVDH